MAIQLMSTCGSIILQKIDGIGFHIVYCLIDSEFRIYWISVHYCLSQAHR